jgi:cobalt/nickel transport system permease protein
VSRTVDQGAPVRAPQWLLQGELAMCPCGCVGKRTKGSYLRKTITSGAQLLQQVMFTEDTAAQAGLLQRIDPRVKVVATVVLLVATSLLRTVPALFALYLATLATAAASALPLGFFIKRVWLFVPVFTGIMVLPATLSLVTHGEVVWTLWHWHGHPEGFTRQGLLGASLVVSRVAVSISLVVLLTLTTPWVRLLAALRGLGVPKMFIMIIGMAYRYIFLLLNGITEMYQARTARTIGSARHDGSARAFLGASVGTLIGRSHQLSEEVHQAMTARGYTGDAKVLHRFALRPADGLYLAAAVAVSVLVVMGERLLVH